MKRLFAILALCALPLLAACTPQQIAAVKRAQHHTEDSPGWSCSTQGNGVCGPITIDTRRMVVIARNGTFRYIATEWGNAPGTGLYACAWGYRPIKAHDYTLLACADADSG